MKRNSFPFLLALLMSMVANVALAYDAEIDGIYYNLSENEATVTYKDMNRNSYSGTVVIPESITYNSKTYSVTSIGYDAFGSSKNLTSITIPKSVSSIGNFAFYDCSAITSITIPESVTSIGVGAFAYCSALTIINITEGVSSIGNSAFSGCSALTSITIPNSVAKIGDEAFSGTAWYENHPDGLVYAGKVAYKYKGTMPENTTIDIKDGTLSIVREAFSGCVGLSSITIPESVTEIGDRAFDGCI